MGQQGWQLKDNATLATAELGHRLIEHYGAILADIVRDASVFPVERFEGPES